MADSDKQDMTSKLIGMGATFLTAWLAQKILAKVWHATVGHDIPKPEEPGEARLGELAAAAALTGAVAYLARVFATRGTAKLLK